jgi:hypothetical protein
MKRGQHRPDGVRLGQGGEGARKKAGAAIRCRRELNRARTLLLQLELIQITATKLPTRCTRLCFRASKVFHGTTTRLALIPHPGRVKGSRRNQRSHLKKNRHKEGYMASMVAAAAVPTSAALLQQSAPPAAVGFSATPLEIAGARGQAEAATMVLHAQRILATQAAAKEATWSSIMQVSSMRAHGWCACMGWVGPACCHGWRCTTWCHACAACRETALAADHDKPRRTSQPAPRRQLAPPPPFCRAHTSSACAAA